MARIVSKKTGSNQKATSETRKRRAGVLAAAVAGVGLFTAQHSFAANGTWMGAGPFPPPSNAPMASYSGDWFNSANWKNSTIANTNPAGAIADFSTLDIPYDGSQGWFDLSGLRSPATVYMYGNQTAYVANLHTGTVVDNGTVWNFTGDNAGSAGTGTLQLRGTRTITVDNGTTQIDLIVANDITTTPYAGQVGLDKEGNGTLILTAGNIYKGDTVISGGALVVNGDAQLGGASNAANLILNYNGTIQYSGDTNVSRNIIVNGLNSGVGAVVPVRYGANYVVGTDPADITIGAGWNSTTKAYTQGSVSGPGTMNITGTGRVWLGVTAAVDNGVVIAGTGATLALVENNKLALSSNLTINNNTLELHADGVYKDGTAAAANWLGGTSVSSGTGFNHNIILNDPNSKISVTDSTGSGAGFYVKIYDPVNNPVISGSGALNKVGNGTLILTNGANTYAGGTNVNAGALMLGNPTAYTASVTPDWTSLPSATGPGTVRVTTGTIGGPGGTLIKQTGTLSSLPGSNGSVAGMVYLAGGIIAPGDVSATSTAAGVVAFNGLNVGFGTMKFDVGSGNTDLVYVGPGGLTLLGGQFSINTATPSNGTYTLINYDANGQAQLVGSVGTVQLTGLAASKYGILGDTGSAGHLIQLTVQDAKPTQVWKGTTNNVWDINTTANWDAGVVYQETGNLGNQVQFDNTGSSSQTNISISGTVHPQEITDLSTSYNYTLGGPGSIAGYTAIYKGSNTQASNVGSGTTLTLSGSNSFTGNVYINNGKVSVNSMALGGPLGNAAMIAFGDPACNITSGNLYSGAYDIYKHMSTYSYSGSPSSNNLASSLYPTAWLQYTGGTNTTTTRLFNVNPAGGTLDLRGTTLDMTGAANLSGSGYLWVVNGANQTGVSRLILRGNNSNFTGVLVISPPEGNTNTGNPVTGAQGLGLLELVTPQSVPTNGMIDLLGTPGFDNNEVVNGMTTQHMHPAFGAAVIEVGGNLTPPGGWPGTTAAYDFGLTLNRPYFTASNASSNPNQFLGSIGQLRMLGANNNSSVGFAAIGATRVVNIGRYNGGSITSPGTPVYGTTMLSKTYGLPNGGGDGWVFGSPNADNMVVFMNGIDLNNTDPRFIRTIRGVGSVPEGMLTGTLVNSGNPIRIYGTGGLVLNNLGDAGQWANGTSGTVTSSGIYFSSGGLFVGGNDAATGGASPLGNNTISLTIGNYYGNIGSTNYNYGPGNVNTGLYTYGKGVFTAQPSITINRNLFMNPASGSPLGSTSMLGNSVGYGTPGSAGNYASPQGPAQISMGGFTADHTAFSGQINTNAGQVSIGVAPGGQVDFTGEITGGGPAANPVPPSIIIGPSIVEGTGGTGTNTSSTTGIWVGRRLAAGGSGVVVFSGNNTFTGNVLVDDGGVLMVSNSMAAGGSGTGYGGVLVARNGILGGSGLVGQVATIDGSSSGTASTPGGILAPHGIGSTPNTLSFDVGLTFRAGGVYSPLITNIASSSDSIIVNQTLTDGGMVFKPTYSSDFSPNPGTVYTVATVNNPKGMITTPPLDGSGGSMPTPPVFSNANDARYVATTYYGLPGETPPPGVLPTPVITATFDWASGRVQWSGTTDGSWEIGGTKGNWTGQPYVNPNRVMFADTDASGAAVVNTAGLATVNLASNVTPLDIQFNNSGVNYTIGSTGGFGMQDPTVSGTQAHVWLTKDGTGTVTLNTQNSLSGQTLIKNGTLSVAYSNTLPSGPITIGNGTLEVQTGYVESRAMTLTGTAGLTVDAGTHMVSGVVSGTGSLNVGGAGTVALLGANTYSGGTVLNGGTTQVNTVNSLGTGPLTINNANFQVTNSLTSSRNVTLNSANSGVIVNPGMAYSNNGVFSGTGSLNLSGSGTLNMSGNNTYSGATNVSGLMTTLNVTNTFGSGTGTGAVNLNAGTYLRGSGVISGTVNATSATINPGSASTPGILTIGGLNADANSTMNFRIGSASDELSVTGSNAFTVNGTAGAGTTINVMSGAGATAGVVYTLLDYNGTGLTANQFGTFRFNMPTVSGLTFTARNDASATSVDVEVGSSANTQTWTGSTNANWDYATNNWSPNPYSNANQLLFNDTGNNTSVNLTANVSPAFIVVNNSSKVYTITSNPGQIDGPTGLMKTGLSQLYMAGDMSFTGAVSVRQGTLFTSKITNAGIPSPIGAGSFVSVGAPDTVPAIFQYQGTIPASTNRTFNFGQAGGTIMLQNGNMTNSSGQAVPTLRLTGPVTGGSLIKTGPGWLQVTGKATLLNEAGAVSGSVLEFTNTASGTAGNNIQGYFTVGGGATLKGPQNALGSAEVRLNSGTLNLYHAMDNTIQMDVWARPSNAIQQYNNATYNTCVPGFGPSATSGLLSSLSTITNYLNGFGAPNSSTVTNTLNWDNSAGSSNPMFASVGVSNLTELVSRWTGLINIPTTGVYTFGTRSDDGSMLFIDGVNVVNNNYFQGMTTRTNTVSLAAGVHNLATFYYQGGGGMGADFYWTPPGTSSQVDIPRSALSLNANSSFPNSRVWVTGNASKLQIDGIQMATMGTGLQGDPTQPNFVPTLKINPNLNLQVFNSWLGATTSTLSMSSTQFNNTSVANYYIDAQEAIGLGSLAAVNSSNAITAYINQNLNNMVGGATGDVIVDGAKSAALPAGSAFDVYNGRLIVLASSASGATNPLGGASVILEANQILALGSSTGLNPTAAIDAAVTLRGSGTIQHLTPNVTTTLGSTGNGVTIGAGGTLTFDIQQGTLNVAGPITGGTGISKIGTGTVIANSFGVPLTISAGTARVGINNGYTLNTLPTIASGGTFEVASGVSQDLNGAQTLTGGATLNAISGASVATAGHFNLNANLTVSGTGTANITTSGTGATPGYLNLGSSGRIISTSTPLNVSAAINGTAGFTKNGSQTMTISGNSTGMLSGNINVTAGTLAVAGAGALGNASVTLSGGNMSLNSGQTYVPGLLEARLKTATSFDTTTIPNGYGVFTNVNQPAGLNNFTAGIRAGILQGESNFVLPNNPLTWDNNQTFVYTGQVYIPNNNGDGTGTVAFAESIDDSEKVAIDGVTLMTDGSYNTNFATGRVTLPVGWHNIEVRLGNGSGGGGLAAQQGWSSYWGLGMSNTQPVPAATLLPSQPDYPVPMDPGDGSLFRTAAPYATTYVGNALNNVTVSGNASIDISATDLGTVSTLGTLNRGAGDTLTVVGVSNATRQLRFLGTNLNASGTVGFDGTGDLATGQITQVAGGPFTIQKKGSGSLILDSVLNNVAGVTFDVQGGRLVTVATGGLSPTGTAPISLDGSGATWQLRNAPATAGATLTAYNLSNPITVTSSASNAAIEHLNHTADTLSGAITLNQALNVKVGMGSLTMTGQITGTSGSLVLGGSGTLTLANPSGASQANSQGMTTVNSGTLQMNQANAVTNLTVNNGTAIMGNAAAIGGTTSSLTMNGGTLNINGYTPTIGTATLSGGTITGSGGVFQPATIVTAAGGATNIATKVNYSSALALNGAAMTFGNAAAGANANVMAGPITVSNGGILGVNCGNTPGGSNPLGAAVINLTGGTAGATITMAGINDNAATLGSGLKAEIYAPINSFPGNNPPNYNIYTSFMALYDAATPALVANTSKNGTYGTDFNNGNGGNGVMFNSLGYTNTLSFSARFTGQIYLANAGVQTFYTASDDGTVLFIDGSATNLSPVVNRNTYTGWGTTTGTYNNTTAGTWHNVAIGFYQGGGGLGMSVGFGGTVATANTFPNSILMGAAPGVNLGVMGTTAGNTVNATGNVNVLFSGTSGGKFGTLNLGTTSGATTLLVGGGVLSADNAVLAGPATIYTNSDGGVTLPFAAAGGINFGSNYSLTKSGPGTLLVQGTGTNSASSNFIVNDGLVSVLSNAAFGAGGFTGTRTGVVGPDGAAGLGVLDIKTGNMVLTNFQVKNDGTLQISSAGQDATQGALLPSAANAITGTFQLNNISTAATFPTVNLGQGGTLSFINTGALNYLGPISLTGRTYLQTSSTGALNMDSVVSATGNGAFWVLDGGTPQINFRNTVNVGNTATMVIDTPAATVVNLTTNGANYGQIAGGSFAGTGAVRVVNGILQVDSTSGTALNTNNWPYTYDGNRLPNTTGPVGLSGGPVTLAGGTLQHLGPWTSTAGILGSPLVYNQPIDKVQIFGQAAINAIFNATTGAANNVSMFTIGNLVRPNASTPGFSFSDPTNNNLPTPGAGALVSFTGTNIGAADGTTRGAVTISAINNGSVTNGIIGGWATINQNGTYNFATLGSDNALSNIVVPLPVSSTIPLAGVQDGSADVSGNVMQTGVSGTKNWTGSSARSNINSINLNMTGGTTLDLGPSGSVSHRLSIGSGGILLSGNSAITIQNGTLTAGGTGSGNSYTDMANGELIFWANNGGTGTLNNINSQIVDNSAGRVAVVETGTAALQLTNPTNSFTGGVFIGQIGAAGQFRIAASDKISNTVGSNNIYFTGPTRLQMHTNGTGSNQVLNSAWFASSGNTGYTPFGNNIYMYADGTIAVDRWDGSNTSNVIVMGNVTMDNRRTLTVTQAGNNAWYSLGINNLVLKGDATLNVLGAPSMGGARGADANMYVYGSLFGNGANPGGSELYKTGLGMLFLNGASTAASRTSMVGARMFVNQGIVDWNDPTALNDSTNKPIPVYVASGAALSAPGTGSVDMSRVSFRPGGILRVDGGTASTLTNLMPVTNVQIAGGSTSAFNVNAGTGIPILAGGTISMFNNNTGIPSSSAVYTFDAKLAPQGNLNIDTTGINLFGWSSPQTADLVLTQPIAGPSVSITKVGGNGSYNRLFLSPSSPSTYGGGTIVNSPFLVAGTRGALGTGIVTINSQGGLELRASQSAANNIYINSGTVIYEANNAAGDNTIFSQGTSQNSPGQINIFSNVTDFGNDSFNLSAYNVIEADSQRMRLLEGRVTVANAGAPPVAANPYSSSGPYISPLSVIAYTDTPAYIPTSLPYRSVYLGVGNDMAPNNLVIGGSTPWRGIATDYRQTYGSLTNGTPARVMWGGNVKIDNTLNTSTDDSLAPAIELLALNGQNLYLGGTAFQKLVPGNAPARAYIAPSNNRTFLMGTQPFNGVADYSGISKFVVMNGATIEIGGLGYGQGIEGQHGQTGPGTGVPVEAAPGGTIDVTGISTGLAINGPVLVDSPFSQGSGTTGRLLLNDARNINGTGFITVQPGSVVQIDSQNTAIANAFGTGAFTQPSNMKANSASPAKGFVIRVGINDITYLNQMSPYAVYEAYSGSANERTLNSTPGSPLGGTTLMPSVQLAYNLTTYTLTGTTSTAIAPGGILTNDGNARNIQDLTTNRVLTLTDANFIGTDPAGAAGFASGNGFGVWIDVNTTKKLVMGSLQNIDGQGKTGTVGFRGYRSDNGTFSSPGVSYGGIFHAGAINWVNGNLAFNSWDTVIGSDLTLSNPNTSGFGTQSTVLYLGVNGPNSTNDGMCYLANRLAGYSVDGATTTTTWMAPHVLLAGAQAGSSNIIDRVEIGFRDDTKKDADGRIHVKQPFIISGDVSNSDKRSFWLGRGNGSSTTLNITMDDVTLNGIVNGVNAPASIGLSTSNINRPRISLKLAGPLNYAVYNNNDYDFQDLSLVSGTSTSTLQVGRTADGGPYNTGLWGTVPNTITLNGIKGYFQFQSGATFNGTLDATANNTTTGANFWIQYYPSATSNGAGATGTGIIKLGLTASKVQDMDTYVGEVASGTAYITTMPLQINVNQTSTSTSGTDIDAVLRSQLNGTASTVKGYAAYTNVHMANLASVTLQEQNQENLLANFVLDTATGNATSGVRTVYSGSGTPSIYIGSVQETSTSGTGNILQIANQGSNNTGKVYLVGALSGKAYVKSNNSNTTYLNGPLTVGSTTLGTGFALGTGTTFETNGGTTSWNGAAASTTGTFVASAGTFALGTANIGTAALNVTGGAVTASAGSTIGGAVTMSSGSITTAGTISGAVTATGGTLMADTGAAVGTATLTNGADLSGGGIVGLKPTGSGSSFAFNLINVTTAGNLKLGGTSKFSVDVSRLAAADNPNNAALTLASFWRSQHLGLARIIDVQGPATNTGNTAIAAASGTVSWNNWGFTTHTDTGANAGDVYLDWSFLGPQQWLRDGGGSWADVNSWTNTALPDGGVANFLGAGSGDMGLKTVANAPATITLDGSHSVTQLIFNNTVKNTTGADLVDSYVLTNGTGTGNTLTVTGGVITDTAGNQKISVPLNISGNTTLTVGASSILAVSAASPVTTTIQSGTTTQAGAGTLTLDSLSLTGNFAANAGITNVAAASGAGTLSVGGGTLNVSGAVSAPVTVSSGTANIAAAGNLSGTVGVSGGALVNSGIVSGTLGVTGGTVTNNLTVSGTANVSAGTVTNAATGTMGAVNVSATGAVVNNGILGGALGITGGTVTNNLTISGATTMSGGTLTNAGTISNTLGVSGGTVTNNATISGATTVSGTGIVNNAATKTMAGLTVNGGAVNNSGAIGAATVSGGSLAGVSGSTLASLGMTGGTLSGTTTVSGAATVSGGTLAPATAGVLTFGAGLDMSGGGAYKFAPTADSTSTGFGTLAVTGGNLKLSNGAFATLSFDLSGVVTSNPFWQQFEEFKVIGLSGTATNTGNTTFAASAYQTAQGWKFTSRSDATGTYLDLVYSGLAQWNVDGGGAWGTGTNWSDGHVPNAIGDVARFLGAGSTDLGLKTAANAPATVNMAADRTVGTLVFDNTVVGTGADTTHSYIIGSTTGNVLHINNGASVGAVNVNSGNQQITTNVFFDGSATVNIASGSSLKIGNGSPVTTTIASTATVTQQTGAGSLNLDVLSLAGTLQANSGNTSINSVTGTGNLNVGGGAVTINGASTAALNVASGSAVTHGAVSGATSVSGGTLNSTGSLGALIASGGAVTAAGPIGAVTQTGGTISTNGTVASLSMPSGTGVFAGAATVSGTATVASGTLAPTNGSAMTFANGLNMSGGGSLLFKPTATGSNDEALSFGTAVVSGGDLLLGGGSKVTFDLSGLTAGQLPQAGDSLWTKPESWKLIDVTTGTNLTNATFGSLANVPTYSGWGFTTSIGTGADAGDVFLNWVSLYNEWKVGNGTFSTATCWSSGSAPAATESANFRGMGVASGTVTASLTAPTTVNKVFFDPNHNGSTASYTIDNGGNAANTLALAGAGADINAASGSHSITAAVLIQADTTVETGSGATLSLDQVQGTTGKTLQIAGGTGTSANAINGGNLQVDAAAKLTLTLKGTNKGGKGSASSVDNLAVVGNGQLDLANNSLAVAGNSTANLVAVNNLVKSGYAGGAWNGSGIITSAYHSSQSDSTDKAPWTTIGVAVIGSNVVAKYTYQGDVNLDGVVNAADFSQIKYGSLNQSNGNINGHALTYSDGDVNYDGVINAADFSSAKSASLNQGGSLAISTPQNVVVPEPSTIGMLAIGALGLLGRRRRSRKA